MDIMFLLHALRKCWSRETCYLPDQEKWSADNPAFGQCAVTALVVQDFLGGEILYCKHYHHYWNRLPDATIGDSTNEQFDENVNPCPYKIVLRKYILESERAKKVETFKRYLVLKRKVNKIIKREVLL